MMADPFAQYTVATPVADPFAAFTAATPQNHIRKRQEILAGKAAAEAEASQASADAYRGLLKTIPDITSTVGSLYGPRGAAAGAAAGETVVQGAQAAAGEGFNTKAIAAAAGGSYAGQKIGGTIGKGIGKVGGVITGSLRRKAVEKATAEYAKAAAAGVTEPTIALTQGIPKLLNRAGRVGQREVDHLLDEYKNFLSNKPADLTPIDLHEIRQVMDEVAQPFYNAVGKLKAPPDPALAAKVRFAKQVADNAREALRRLVPDATKYEAQASRAIGARKFIPVGTAGSLGEKTARYGLASTAGFMAGGLHGMGEASLAMALMSQPQVAMLIGKILESGLIPGTLGQTGRAIGQTTGRQIANGTP